MRNVLPILLTFGLLTGCSKTDNPPKDSIVQPQLPAAQSRPLAPPPTQAPDARARIVVLGDSLAEGLGVAPEQSYPSILQAKLDRAGYKYRVVNMGLSGDTTTGGLSRLNAALSQKPAILVIELGGNDGLRGVPTATTRSNLEKMTVAAKRAGAEVLLAGMTLPLNYGSDYIKRFEATFHDVAREHSVQLVPSLFQPIVDQVESRPELMQRDGIHPAPEGHELMADHVFRYLKPMLSKTHARS